MTAARDTYGRPLSKSAVVAHNLLTVLAHVSDFSPEQLAEAVGVSPQHAQTHLRRLRERGFVVRRLRPGVKGIRHLYRLKGAP